MRGAGQAGREGGRGVVPGRQVAGRGEPGPPEVVVGTSQPAGPSRGGRGAQQAGRGRGAGRRGRDLATQPLGKGICRHIMLA